ncbi:MAG TPA: DUF2007 domain-containing protein [Solirubrobacteraceae bacterium]|jgi:hypothetical protein|nr:DUF2007 domain-containing protein [Solirubrobacteraceae bacterium]
MSDEPTLVTTAPTEADAAIVIGRLEEAGISCFAVPAIGAYRARPGVRRLYVRAADLDRARAVVSEGEAPFDEAELARLSEQAGQKAIERALRNRPGDRRA